MSLILEDLLTDCARESLTVGADGAAVDALNAAMQGDLAMQKEAWNCLARDSLIRERDHLARWRFSLLSRALANVG